jgi:hypothetical protein
MTHATKREYAVLVARGLRGMCNGFVAVLLPGYLLALGLDNWLSDSSERPRCSARL